MQPKTDYPILFLAGLLCLLSLFAFLINALVYQYPGNNFFPVNVTLVWLILLINYTGLLLYFGKNTKATDAGKEILYFAGVMSIIAFASNAVQLTPFKPIDAQLLKMDKYLFIDMNAILAWINRYPNFKKLLEFIYDTLPYQMSILPLCVLATTRFYLLRDYYFLMLLTALIGFSLYYFFPSTAPASIIANPLFSSAQLATGYKFYQIHHHIQPTTNEGGLIAMPSFHAIWALLCVYLLKEWWIPCLLLFLFNLLLITSCVLLGWHYLVDIMGALILIAIACYFLILIKR